jgi:hypothetical protein
VRQRPNVRWRRAKNFSARTKSAGSDVAANKRTPIPVFAVASLQRPFLPADKLTKPLSVSLR